MDGILPELRWIDQQRLIERARGCGDARLKEHYLIIVNLIHGRSPAETAAALNLAKSTVYRVAGRFREQGEVGLLDRREDNGDLKLDEGYLSKLYEVVRGCPEDYGWKRPTWTREMLVRTLAERTGLGIHVGTMSRALKMIGARRGRPRPTVACPWPKRRKSQRIRAIRKMVGWLPRGHVAVYEDEVDIHLNPKIGLDWMVRGQQKEVETPGQNQKRYLAGAMNAVTRELVWVEGTQKNSDLFIALLGKLAQVYAQAKVIHVIVDNYRIHHSRITQMVVASAGGKIVLHFLPPYCPNENKIERLWQDLHADVTRNHHCRSMEELMQNVRSFLRRRTARARRHYRRHAA
jgi:putative transposase